MTFWSWAACVSSQTSRLHFHHLTQDEGLKQTQNAFLFKDSEGLLWISSLEDVYLFNGDYAVTAETFWEGKWDSGIENIQSAFFEDGDQSIWFTTYTSICRFDRCRNTFSSGRIIHPRGDTIPDNYRLIHLEGDSLLWVAAGKGLYRYHITGSSDLIATGDFEGVRFAVDTSATGEVERIFSSPWVSRNGFDIFSFEHGAFLKKESFFDRQTTKFPPLKISQLLFENDSLLWLFSDRGLVEFNPVRPEAYKIHTPEGPGGSLAFRNGIEFNERYLLTSATNQGLWAFDKIEGRFIHNWKHDPNEPSSLASDNPKEIFMDPDGSIWISHYGKGLDYIFPDQLKFSTCFQKVASLPESPSINFHHLVEGNAGEILGGSSSQGFLKADLENKRIIRLFLPDKNGNGQTETRIRFINRSEVFGLVWVTTEQSVNAFNSDDQAVLSVFPQDGERFWSAVQLSSYEALVSTNAGIKKIDFSGPEVRFERPDGLPTAFKSDEIDFLYSDAAGYLYFPIESRDLLVYTYENGSLQLVKKLPLDARINHFFDDGKENCIWLGTSRGLFRVDKEGFDLVQHDAFTGLPPLAVYGVLPDDRAHLWLSTNDGLLDYDPASGSYYQYHPEEGLQSNEFSQFAALRTSDGRLWFGGPNGLNGFYPDSIAPYPHPPRILIENIRVNDQPLVQGDCRAERVGLNLRYWQNTLSFDLYALCNYLSEYNRLHFRVKGYDEVWTEAKNGQEVRLFRLPPGEYTLEVIAANANNVTSQTKRLNFQIAPPFWQTGWFRLLVVAAIGMVIYSGVRLYIRRRLRLQQIEIDRQNALQAERNRIASELHDDLGSGLSIIRYLSEHARRRETDDKQRTQIERISQSARDLIEKMGDIIWAMNSENDQLDNLLYHLEDYAEDYLAGNELDCAFRLPERMPAVELSGERRRNILLTVKEVLHNVVKHAGASRVAIDCSVDGHLLIRIQDDGHGIDLDNVRRGGNGLKNMEKRMMAIGGEFHIFNDEGTVVELKVPLGPK